METSCASSASTCCSRKGFGAQAACGAGHNERSAERGEPAWPTVGPSALPNWPAPTALGLVAGAERALAARDAASAD